MTDTPTAVELKTFRTVAHHLEEIQTWAMRRSHSIGLTLKGTYMEDKLDDHQRLILESLREDLCRANMARHADELLKLGVKVELDFNWQEYLSGKEFAKMVERNRPKVARGLPDADSD